MHQGLYLEADPLPAPDFGDLEPDDIVLVLDQITDPHNVGAIIRPRPPSPSRRSSPPSAIRRPRPACCKGGLGGLEHVPIVHVRNLGDMLDELGGSGVMRVGLDSAGPQSLAETPLRGPLALVLGAEDKGLRQRTRSFCDALARLDMPGAIKSLNVSNAGALALYVARAGLDRASPG